MITPQVAAKWIAPLFGKTTDQGLQVVRKLQSAALIPSGRQYVSIVFSRREIATICLGYAVPGPFSRIAAATRSVCDLVDENGMTLLDRLDLCLGGHIEAIEQRRPWDAYRAGVQIHRKSGLVWADMIDGARPFGTHTPGSPDEFLASIARLHDAAPSAQTTTCISWDVLRYVAQLALTDMQTVERFMWKRAARVNRSVSASA